MESKSIFAITAALLACGLMCGEVYSQKQNTHDISKYIGGKLMEISTQTFEYENTDNCLDTLYSFPSPDDMPSGLAWDGAFFWHNDSYSNLIYKLTTTGEIIFTIPLPSASWWSGGGLTWDGSHLWYANEESATLYKIDSNTGETIAQFFLPSSGLSDPNGWGLAWDGEYLWHSEYVNPAVIYKLNPQTGEVISQFTPPFDLILGITWADGFLYGVRIDNEIPGAMLYKFEPESGTILDSTFWGIYHPLGLTWDDEFFWNVSRNDKRIYKCSKIITTTNENQISKSKGIILNQPTPNPCTDQALISFFIPYNSEVRIDIYSLSGAYVSKQLNKKLPKGKHKLVLDTSGFNEGIYFCVLKTHEGIQTRKIIKL